MLDRNLLIVSTSTVYGTPYLSYMGEAISAHFKGCTEIVFIPFARPMGVSWDEYTEKVRSYFYTLGILVKGIHEFEDMEKGLSNAQGVFTGGGNTFVLLKEIYDQGLIDSLRHKISTGMPYMGTSAGANITGLNIKTTNDMPIVYPQTFNAIGAVPFNINPHFLDAIPNGQHMGESRDTRIKEFLIYNNIPVVGLREGSYLVVQGDAIALCGKPKAWIYTQNKNPYEIESGGDLSFLLEDNTED